LEGVGVEREVEPQIDVVEPRVEMDEKPARRVKKPTINGWAIGSTMIAIGLAWYIFKKIS
jgi:hypothetical protein